jgi:anti-sigma-K factor RskA
MMGQSEEDRSALAGAHALGLLDEAETERAEMLMDRDSRFAEDVRGWQRRFAPLDATAEPIAPSPQLWQRIEASLGAPQRIVEIRPRAEASVRLWDRIDFWRWSAISGLGAAAMLALMLGTAVLRWPTQPLMVAVLTNDNGRPGAVVETFADGRVRLIPLQDIAVPEGRALQVWTLRDRQEGPISVGLLSRAQTSRLNLGSLPAPRADQLFEITLEPETGSPTGRPTGPVLMKGLTANTL